MRGRNTMRFSAPTREPPGGRPSRGAKLKGRGCTRQKDARNENRLGGTGAAKKAPSEQGATKAAGLGAADARLEPRQWSAAERLSRDRRRKRRCCARAATEKSARRRSSAFFSIAARYTLAHTKAGARSGDAGNTDFPLGFLLGGLCGGSSTFPIGKSPIFAAYETAYLHSHRPEIILRFSGMCGAWSGSSDHQLGRGRQK